MGGRKWGDVPGKGWEAFNIDRLTECGHTDSHFAIKQYRLEQICSLGVGRKARSGDVKIQRKEEMEA